MALGVPVKLSVLVVPEHTLNGLAVRFAVTKGTVEMLKDWLSDWVQLLAPLVVRLVKLYTKLEVTLGMEIVAVPLAFRGSV